MCGFFLWPYNCMLFVYDALIWTNTCRWSFYVLKSLHSTVSTLPTDAYSLILFTLIVSKRKNFTFNFHLIINKVPTLYDTGRQKKSLIKYSIMLAVPLLRVQEYYNYWHFMQVQVKGCNNTFFFSFDRLQGLQQGNSEISTA